jgi:hypothetical protein
VTLRRQADAIPTEMPLKLIIAIIESKRKVSNSAGGFTPPGTP